MRTTSRAFPALILAAGLSWALVVSAQQQVAGRIVDRNGSPQPRCLVEFFLNPNAPPVYRVAANNDGYFYIANPRYGQYTVLVRLGQRQHRVLVTIDGQGLHPSTIIVTW